VPRQGRPTLWGVRSQAARRGPVRRAIIPSPNANQMTARINTANRKNAAEAQPQANRAISEVDRATSLGFAAFPRRMPQSGLGAIQTGPNDAAAYGFATAARERRPP
jgi:hypothetical protein